MSHGAPMPDAAAQVEGKETRRKTHSGPRKRRPKKKTASCRSNGSLTPERSRDVNVPLSDDVLTKPREACVPAVAFAPLPNRSRQIDSLSSTSDSSPGTDQLFRSPIKISVETSSCTSLICSAQAPAVPNFNHSKLSVEEKLKLKREEEKEAAERAYWTQWVIQAAEKERTRRLNVLKQLQWEEEEEVRRRRRWAIATIEKEQEAMMREMFLDNMKNTQWFQTTISRFSEDYEVVCPNSWFGCTFSCMLKDLESHLKLCVYRQVPDTLDQVVEDTMTDFYSYDVVCPNALLGCREICSRENLADHLPNCPVNGISREKEWEERLEWRRNVIQATEKERERRMDEERLEGRASGGDLSFGNLQRLYEEQTAMLQVVLHDEIVDFYAHHRSEARKKRPWMQKAIAMVTEEIVRLWNHCVRVEGYGSFATKLHGEASDVDLVVFGATEEFHCTGQQCVQALADHLHTLSAFVDVSAITHASIPLLKVVVSVTIDRDETTGNATSRSKSESVELRIPFDITFDEPQSIHHNGVASVTMVQGLANAFYGLRELTFVLKHFLVKRGLNDPYVGGLSSYGLLLMVVYALQEQDALISRTDGPTLSNDSGDEEEEEEERKELEPRALQPSTARCNLRYESQCLKGELLAKKIIDHCVAKQQLTKTSGTRKRGVKRPKRAVLPYFVTDSDERGEHEAKPYFLGKLLMNFLQFYGDDFRQNLDVISIVSWNDSPCVPMETPLNVNSLSPPTLSPSPPHSSPTGGRHSSNCPLSHDGLLVIEDPLQPTNNVGKTCYRVSQVFRDFSDFLSFLTALIVRGSVMTVGKKKMIDSTSIHKSMSSSPTATSSSAAAAHEPMCRILRSVFEMKTR